MLRGWRYDSRHGKERKGHLVGQTRPDATNFVSTRLHPQIIRMDSRLNFGPSRRSRVPTVEPIYKEDTSA